MHNWRKMMVVRKVKSRERENLFHFRLSAIFCHSIWEERVYFLLSFKEKYSSIHNMSLLSKKLCGKTRITATNQENLKWRRQWRHFLLLQSHWFCGSKDVMEILSTLWLLCSRVWLPLAEVRHVIEKFCVFNGSKKVRVKWSYWEMSQSWAIEVLILLLAVMTLITSVFKIIML